MSENAKNGSNWFQFSVNKITLLELVFGSVGKISKQPLAKEGSIKSNLSQQTIEIIIEDFDENEDIHAIEKVEEETNHA